MSDLYDIGETNAHANDFISKGSPGAGDISNEPVEPGMDTSGMLLNVKEDPQLDQLTTGEFHVTDFAEHIKFQNKLLQSLADQYEKIAYNKRDYVRAVPFRNATGMFRANIGTLAGYSLRETSGQALTIDIFDSLDGSNLLYLLSIQLAANGTDKFFMLPEGVDFTQGIYLKLTGTGVAVGALWFARKG